MMLQGASNGAVAFLKNQPKYAVSVLKFYTENETIAATAL